MLIDANNNQLSQPGIVTSPDLTMTLSDLTVTDDTHKAQKLSVTGSSELEAAVSADHILCRALGVETECADWLQTLNAETRRRHDDQYWVVQYMQLKAGGESGGEWGEWGVERVVARLTVLGFTSQRAADLADHLTQDAAYFSHQTLLYFAERFVEDAFQSSPLLTEVPPYQYPGHVGKWKSHVVERDDDDDEDDDDDDHSAVDSKVDVINLSHIKDTRYENKNGAVFPPCSDSDFEVWYHGTNHKSARSLIEDGILLRKGHANQDFSDDHGFYLSDSLKSAQEWAYNISSVPAVVVYKVTKEIVAQFEDRKISLIEGPDWQKVIRYNRKGIPLEEANFTVKQFKSANCVQGPMYNGDKNFDNPRAIPGKVQLCIKSEEMAKAFGAVRNICGVLFYEYKKKEKKKN